jgi:hypothetical protein
MQKTPAKAAFPSFLEAVRRAADDGANGRPAGRISGMLYATLGDLAPLAAGAPASLYEAPLPREEIEPALAGAETVAADLALHRALTPEEIHRIRRQFALKNHPDRVPPRLRALATQRMTEANRLVAEALARCRGEE